MKPGIPQEAFKKESDNLASIWLWHSLIELTGEDNGLNKNKIDR